MFDRSSRSARWKLVEARHSTKDDQTSSSQVKDKNGRDIPNGAVSRSESPRIVGFQKGVGRNIVGTNALNGNGAALKASAKLSICRAADLSDRSVGSERDGNWESRRKLRRKTRRTHRAKYGKLTGEEVETDSSGDILDAQRRGS